MIIVLGAGLAASLDGAGGLKSMDFFPACTTSGKVKKWKPSKVYGPTYTSKRTEPTWTYSWKRYSPKQKSSLSAILIDIKNGEQTEYWCLGRV